MFWTGCEVADLNQGQKTIKMNHRNKIQSLVSPTDDPGDAPDCMCESGPLYLKYGRMCHAAPTAQKYGFSVQAYQHGLHRNRPIFQSMGFPCNQCWILSPWCCQNGQKACQPQNMANSKKTAKKSPKLKKKVKNEKNIFEKIRNFSALDERDCQAAWLFAHWGQFGRETRAWPDGADPPHFHMHIGKIGQFLKIRVFPATNAGLSLIHISEPTRP